MSFNMSLSLKKSSLGLHQVQTFCVYSWRTCSTVSPDRGKQKGRWNFSVRSSLIFHLLSCQQSPLRSTQGQLISQVLMTTEKKFPLCVLVSSSSSTGARTPSSLPRLSICRCQLNCKIQPNTCMDQALQKVELVYVMYVQWALQLSEKISHKNWVSQLRVNLPQQSRQHWNISVEIHSAAEELKQRDMCRTVSFIPLSSSPYLSVGKRMQMFIPFLRHCDRINIYSSAQQVLQIEQHFACLSMSSRKTHISIFS